MDASCMVIAYKLTGKSSYKCKVLECIWLFRASRDLFFGMIVRCSYYAESSSSFYDVVGPPKIVGKLNNFINFLLLYNSLQFSHFIVWKLSQSADGDQSGSRVSRFGSEADWPISLLTIAVRTRTHKSTRCSDRRRSSKLLMQHSFIASRRDIAQSMRWTTRNLIKLNHNGTLIESSWGSMGWWMGLSLVHTKCVSQTEFL